MLQDVRIIFKVPDMLPQQEKTRENCIVGVILNFEKIKKQRHGWCAITHHFGDPYNKHLNQHLVDIFAYSGQ